MWSLQKVEKSPVINILIKMNVTIIKVLLNLLTSTELQNCTLAISPHTPISFAIYDELIHDRHSSDITSYLTKKNVLVSKIQISGLSRVETFQTTFFLEFYWQWLCGIFLEFSGQLKKQRKVSFDLFELIYLGLAHRHIFLC